MSGMCCFAAKRECSVLYGNLALFCVFFMVLERPNCVDTFLTVIVMKTPDPLLFDKGVAQHLSLDRGPL